MTTTAPTSSAVSVASSYQRRRGRRLGHQRQRARLAARFGYPDAATEP